MKVSMKIEPQEHRVGFFKKETHHHVTARVDFAPEERQARRGDVHVDDAADDNAAACTRLDLGLAMISARAGPGFSPFSSK